MTDREKLIKLICDNIQNDECIAHCNRPPCCECLELADYLLANGVIVPPCKEGDVVYYSDDIFETVEKCRVYGFTIVNGKKLLLVDNGEYKFVISDWYTTIEEAEKALAERNKEK